MKKNNLITLGIDASNISAGGGLTHLVELLRVVNPILYGFDKIIIWSSTATLDCIENKPWLLKKTNPILEKNFLLRALWQRKELSQLARKENCALLFVPGGSFSNNFSPIVTMSQNLLPFEWKELKRHGLSTHTLKGLALRIFQSSSFKKANGIIFLSEYAQDAVLKVTGSLKGKKSIISHGVDQRFFIYPREQKNITEYNNTKPFRIMYVSSIFPYKHHFNIVKAINNLHNEGFPIVLDLYGYSDTYSLNKLKKIIRKVDSDNSYIKFHGFSDHANFHEKYKISNISVFASSCETFGQILLESMAAGLPIAASNMSAIPELLGDSCLYFNPLDPNEITSSIRKLIVSPELRIENAQKSYKQAKQFSWHKCADKTFSFLQANMSR